jgi:hypothetical protein
MSKVSRFALALALSLALGFGADVAGNWKMSADAPDGNTYKFTLAVKGSGSDMSGTISSPELGVHWPRRRVIPERLWVRVKRRPPEPLPPLAPLM